MKKEILMPEAGSKMDGSGSGVFAEGIRSIENENIEENDFNEAGNHFSSASQPYNLEGESLW